ncbi:thiamine pyrophosphokinase [Mucilaginibacter yixingensis]|uniref:Thiamine pyrophosphokinase n=1 Tax=Mucilaginibacter yixingensis TaxID=1295612 RepID=A0A2T5J5I6_9SPHI|nr:thiamine pyrophosphokinase [Mucilaginibacter yixingensis]PTQ93248.1 thiamine pyrophosphokinase [Mucilaginibacter yixingensis]
MSSHHIIREKQEPALLILSLEDFPDDWLGQLLEWSPTVLAAADVAESLQCQDIKVDIILGADVLPAQEHVNPVTTTVEDVLITGLQLLKTEGYPAVNIVSNRFNADAIRSFLPALDVVVYHQQQKIVAIRSGFSKWLPAGRVVRILEHLPNLVYTNLAGVAPDVYKIVQDGLFSISFDGDYLFIAEEL